jgi:hypothetical protein
MPISDNIGAAIEQLRPELPALLGNDYSQFIAQLEASLARGSEDQVLGLFEEQYPAVYDRLLDILGQQRKKEATKGIDSFPNITLAGQEGTLPYDPAYWCESGHHIVYQSQVKKQDIRGRRFCPNPEHTELLTDYSPRSQ